MRPGRQSSSALRSALYECRVLHHRRTPRDHRFVYRLFYFAIDLDELPEIGRASRFFSVERKNIFSFRERDFLPTQEPAFNPTRPASPVCEATLKSRVLSFCAENGVSLAGESRVVLVTLPRVLGHRFNPVSFYFCHDADGRPRAAIAEVTNTFHEVKPYFIPLSEEGGQGGGVFRVRCPKHFYVSPFTSLEAEFDFPLRAPERRLAIRIDDQEGGRVLVHSTLTGERVAFTDARLAWFVFKYPLVTGGIVMRIHWQALRLWLKRVPFFRKADRPDRQRDLHRPHSSITNPAS